ncbi:MAG: hypothetical protein NC416_08670 [Eubacterium sp.]|nr:hypothetical protein [Eubacterium sp.]
MNKHNLFTSNFKKSCRKNLCFFMKLACVFIALVLFMSVIVMPQYLYAYTASLNDKMERLKSIQEPKIVLIGNSNLSFGINSELLEEAFDMPVVNMGLQGALGNAFHEEMAKVNVREGDIIIVAHTEYADQDNFLDPVIAWLTVENHPQLWHLIRLKDIPDMFFSFSIYAKKSLTLWASKEGNMPDHGTVYDRSAFNEYGDVAFERTTGSYTFTENSTCLPTINTVCTERLNNLNRYVTDRGAYLVVAAYPIADGEFTPPETEYLQFQTELQEALDCPVISDYRDYFLDYDYFYDTAYHLTTEGAAIRTRQLIQDLRQWMTATDR